MAKDLTKRQREIFEYIVSYTEEKGFQPSFRDIGDHFSIRSTKGVSDHLDAIIKKGYLTKDLKRARSMVITKLGELNKSKKRIKHVPLKEASVRLGNFTYAYDKDSDDGVFAFDCDLVRGEQTFLLRAAGNSMINAHIQDGDLILVNPDVKEPLNGDIVVAYLNDEATVKRYYRENGHVRLQPENDSLKPIYITEKSGDFKILGKVVGIFRKY